MGEKMSFGNSIPEGQQNKAFKNETHPAKEREGILATPEYMKMDDNQIQVGFNWFFKGENFTKEDVKNYLEDIGYTDSFDYIEQIEEVEVLNAARDIEPKKVSVATITFHSPKPGHEIVVSMVNKM